MYTYIKVDYVPTNLHAPTVVLNHRRAYVFALTYVLHAPKIRYAPSLTNSLMPRQITPVTRRRLIRHVRRYNDVVFYGVRESNHIELNEARATGSMFWL